MKNFLNIALLFLLTISVIGCSSDSLSVDEPAADGSEMVTFTLNVYAGDPDASGSRAGTLPGDDYFEEPQTQYERMRTLRIVMVHADGTIEHNELLQSTIPDAGLGQYDGVRLRVTGNETKRVYLFANEASMVDAQGNPLLDFASMRIGSDFPTDQVAEATLSASPASPLIDNTGAEKRFIPMSEVFDVFVREAQPDGTDAEQSANFFITRAAVKFTFFAKVSATPVATYKISKFYISKLANRDFLFPSKTEYVPAKYPVSDADRYITSYDVPASAQNELVEFNPGWTFTPQTPPTQVMTFSPALYFAETKLPAGEQFTIKLMLDGDGNHPDHEIEVPLPNLPYGLPRNTHVKVYLDFAFSDLNMIVDVTPYTAVALNPTFGFDQLTPRPPIKPGETPPWVTIDPDENK